MVTKQNYVTWILWHEIVLYSFIVYIETKDFYKEISKDKFDTSNYKLDRLLPNRKNNNIIRLMKDELGKKKHEKICWTKSKNL